MLDREKKLQVLDIGVVIVLFIIGCLIGKLVMIRYDTWISFNGPALGVLAIGGLIWWRIRKWLIKKWESGKSDDNS